MRKFIWKESFAIGIDDIDRQHRSLLGYLNECIDSVSSGDTQVDAHELFNKLKAYARLHFTSEELLMSKIGYPEREQHRKQHMLFEQHVEELEKNVHAVEKGAIASLVPFLREWYLQHILVEDKQYAAYMHSKGFGKNGFDFSIW